jgi:hypothetical protein
MDLERPGFKSDERHRLVAENCRVIFYIEGGIEITLPNGSVVDVASHPGKIVSAKTADEVTKSIRPK